MLASATETVDAWAMLEPDSAWLSDRQRRIAKWLSESSADLAELYLAGARLLHGPQDVPAHLRLVAHAGREIMNRLPSFIAPEERKPFSYRTQVDHLKGTLGGLSLDSASTGSAGPLPPSAIDSLRALLDGHSAVSVGNVDRARRLLVAATRSTQPEMLRPLARSWMDIYDFFVAVVHVPNEPSTRAAQEYFDRFSRMESILFTLAEDFYTPLRELDEILADPDATLEQAIALAAHTEQLRYLFEKLDKPEWVKPLTIQKYFSAPPEPIVEADGELVRFPPWPALGFLARVATRAPDDVLFAAEQIPDTVNLSVLAGILDVAVRLPPSHAARLMAKITPRLRGTEPFHAIIEHRLEPLLGYLAKGKQLNATDQLLLAAAKTLPVKQQYERPRARLSNWSYDRLFSSNMAFLLDLDAHRFLNRFIELLRSAVKNSLGRDMAAKQDFSIYWRPLIASTSGHADDPRDVLVDAVRDAALRIAIDAQTAAVVIRKLDEEKFSVFKRIALHVALERRDEAPTEAVRQMMTEENFQSDDRRPEYAQLVDGASSLLGEEERSIILRWIERGPDLSFLKNGSDGAREDLREEHRRQYVESWQLEKLVVLDKILNANWQARYEILSKKHGSPDDPKVVQLPEVFVGPASPFELSELKTLSVDALLRKVRGWVPPEDRFMGASPSGLGRQLAEIVSTSPESFVDSSKILDLEPTYVRAIIDGFYAALSSDRSIPWESALSVVEFVLSRDIAPAAKDDGGDALNQDSGWRWSRMSAARLLKHGLSKKAPDLCLRQRIWSCIEILLADSDPTIEHEEEQLEHGGEVVDIALNSTRPITFEAALHYANWVRDGAPNTTKSLRDLPEVRVALEMILDGRIRPSFAVRWVFGSWFAFLIELDGDWAARKADELFGTKIHSTPLESIAWRAFVSKTDADPKSYVMLRGSYDRAIQGIGGQVRGRRRSDSPDEGLARHLIRLYWLGTTELTSDEAPLRRFYLAANAQLRAYVMQFLGRGLYGASASALSTERLERLRTFWEWRLGALAGMAQEERGSECAGFGWWFIGGKLDDEWLLAQLQAALRLHPQVESSMLVIERLADLAVSQPAASLECLELLVRGDRVGWNIESWKKNAIRILQSGLNEPTTTAQSRALVNDLGRRGFPEYGILL